MGYVVEQRPKPVDAKKEASFSLFSLIVLWIQKLIERWRSCQNNFPKPIEQRVTRQSIAKEASQIYEQVIQFWPELCDEEREVVDAIGALSDLDLMVKKRLLYSALITTECELSEEDQRTMYRLARSLTLDDGRPIISSTGTVHWLREQAYALGASEARKGPPPKPTINSPTSRSK